MNKRVVVFLDYGADGSDGGVVDFILPEFQMVRLRVTHYSHLTLSLLSVGLGGPVLAY
jgi:hypothetical protein